MLNSQENKEIQKTKKRSDLFERMLKFGEEIRKNKKEEERKNKETNNGELEEIDKTSNSTESTKEEVKKTIETTKEKVKINSNIESVSIWWKIFEYKITKFELDKENNFYLDLKIRDKDKKNFSIFGISGKFDSINSIKEWNTQAIFKSIKWLKIIRIIKSDRYNGGTVFGSMGYKKEFYDNIFSFNYFRKFFQTREIDVHNILIKEIKRFIIEQDDIKQENKNSN